MARVAGAALLAATTALLPATPGFAADSSAPLAGTVPAASGSHGITGTKQDNQRPDTPTSLTTAPATECSAKPPTIIGDQAVYLYAPVSDPDGGVLGVNFVLWRSADAAENPLVTSDPHLLTYSSGTTAVLVVPVAILRAAAGDSVTKFSWKVRVTDFQKSSKWSSTCRFKFDPTRPNAPVFTAPVGTTIGTPATVSISPPASGPTPASYHYQVNGGPSVKVPAIRGKATMTITPRSFTNILTVTSLSVGGNFGESASLHFFSDFPPPAADADLTGDGVADLVAVGGTHGLPSGLWLMPGGTSGTQAEATNIGVNGNGFGSEGSSSFDGAQVITGKFTGSSFEDYLIYLPTGDRAGMASIVGGNGDGSVLQPLQNQFRIYAEQLLDEFDNSPLQLANAGDSGKRGLSHPDLIGTSGDPVNGYHLTYYPNLGSTIGYIMVIQTNAATPTGGSDWENWTISTAQLSGGTSMFLWNRHTGALHLWADLAMDLETGELSYTPYELATNWNPGATLQLRAADINADGTADLWTVGAGRTATAWLVSNLTGGTGTITAQPAQTLLVPSL